MADDNGTSRNVIDDEQQWRGLLQNFLWQRGRQQQQEQEHQQQLVMMLSSANPQGPAQQHQQQQIPAAAARQHQHHHHPATMYQLPAAVDAPSSSSSSSPNNIPLFSHQQQTGGAGLPVSYSGHHSAATNSSSSSIGADAAGAAVAGEDNKWCYLPARTSPPPAGVPITIRTTTTATADSSDNRQQALCAAGTSSSSSYDIFTAAPPSGSSSTSMAAMLLDQQHSSRTTGRMAIANLLGASAASGNQEATSAISTSEPMIKTTTAGPNSSTMLDIQQQRNLHNLRTNNSIDIGGGFPHHQGGMIDRNSNDAQQIDAAVGAWKKDLVSSYPPWSQHDGTIAPTSLETLRELMQRQVNVPSHATRATGRMSFIPSITTAAPTNSNSAASQLGFPVRPNGNASGDIIINGISKVSTSTSSFAGDEDAKAPNKRVASFSEAATSADGDRVEQKKCKEKKRRSDLTDKFRALSSLLWDIDDAELDPAISLNCLTGTGVPSPDRKKRKLSERQRHLSDSAVLPSNRIEVVARAIEVISTLRNVNRCLKEKVSNDGNEYHRNEAYLIAAAASESSKKKF